MRGNLRFPLIGALTGHSQETFFRTDRAGICAPALPPHGWDLLIEYSKRRLVTVGSWAAAGETPAAMAGLLTAEIAPLVYSSAVWQQERKSKAS